METSIGRAILKLAKEGREGKGTSSTKNNASDRRRRKKVSWR